MKVIGDDKKITDQVVSGYPLIFAASLALLLLGGLYLLSDSGCLAYFSKGQGLVQDCENNFPVARRSYFSILVVTFLLFGAGIILIKNAKILNPNDKK